MPHEAVYCDACRKNLATFSLLQDVEGKTVRRRLCRECATREGSGLAWLQAIEEQAGGASGGDTTLPEEMNALLDAAHDSNADTDFDATLLAEFDDDELSELFNELEPALEELDTENFLDDDELEPLLEALDNQLQTPETAELSPSEQLDALPVSESYPNRCPKCDTTWDRLREDGRTGCAYCYEAFADKLLEVMEKMQRAPQHVGKIPLALLKRRQRLHDLRKQRDNRLQMLQNRLKEAIATENYEDAAALRDKIKMVESTIVDDRP